MYRLISISDKVPALVVTIITIMPETPKGFLEFVALISLLRMIPGRIVDLMKIYLTCS